MFEGLLVVLLGNVLHGAVHGGAPRAVPRLSGQLPGRHAAHSTDLPGNQPKTGGEMIPPVYIGVRAVSRTGQHIPGGHALAGPPSTNYPGPSE